MAVEHRSLRTCISTNSGIRSRGATLVELMIVVAMLGILAALVIPVFRPLSDEARVEAMATNLRHVQRLIIQHAGLRDVPLSSGGYPAAIDPVWFGAEGMPLHTFTNRTLVIETVDGDPADVYPAVKTFDPTVAADANAWYNTANGSFCARIPAMNNDAETLQVFNNVNRASATALNQTTR